MIRYGTTEFDILAGSLSVVNTNNTEVRNYPGKDTSDYFDLGKSPTKINCAILIKNESDKTLLKSLLHSPEKRELTLINAGEYYKEVIDASDFNIKPLSGQYTGYYTIEVEFIALNPIPYSVDTDEVMY